MKKSHRKAKDGFIWTSYSDLSTGMMMSFILLLMYTLHDLKKAYSDYDNLKKQSSHVRESKESMDEIYVEFKDVIRKMQSNHKDSCSGVRFEIPEKTTIRISFVGNVAWFKEGQYELNESGRSCLKVFGPLLLKQMFLVDKKLKKKLSQITIEGHTNSNPLKGGNDPYIDNLDLSQKRALETAKFIIKNSQSLDTTLSANFKDWRQKTLAANGRSFADLITRNSIEDKEASKRVEFKASLNHDI